MKQDPLSLLFWITLILILPIGAILSIVQKDAKPFLASIGLIVTIFGTAAILTVKGVP